MVEKAYLETEDTFAVMLFTSNNFWIYIIYLTGKFIFEDNGS